MLSLGIAHKWPLLSLTRICENWKLKKDVRRWTLDIRLKKLCNFSTVTAYIGPIL